MNRSKRKRETRARRTMTRRRYHRTLSRKRTYPRRKRTFKRGGAWPSFNWFQRTDNGAAQQPPLNMPKLKVSRSSVISYLDELREKRAQNRCKDTKWWLKKSDICKKLEQNLAFANNKDNFQYLDDRMLTNKNQIPFNETPNSPPSNVNSRLVFGSQRQQQDVFGSQRQQQDVFGSKRQQHESGFGKDKIIEITQTIDLPKLTRPSREYPDPKNPWSTNAKSNPIQSSIANPIQSIENINNQIEILKKQISPTDTDCTNTNKLKKFVSEQSAIHGLHQAAILSSIIDTVPRNCQDVLFNP